MKVIIIGGGIAGLTTGVYARKSGIDAEIYELHSLPGGECTGWNRGEYHFDGCIHWLNGTKQSSGVHAIWEDTGALDDTVEIINDEVFMRVEIDGRAANIYKDVDKFEAHLLEISPADRKLIRKTCRDIRKFGDMEIPVEKPLDMMKAGEGIRMGFSMLPLMATMAKYSSVSIKDFAGQFRDPLLQAVFSNLGPAYSQATGILMVLGGFHGGDGGWPVGGSKALAKRMERKFIELGGEVSYNSTVEDIIVENGRAVGIQLKDGSKKYGDYIISCADGHATFYDMLKGKYSHPQLEERFSDIEKYPIVNNNSLICFGVDADLSEEPHSVYVRSHHPVDGGGTTNEMVLIKHYCFDTSLAPTGKSVVSCFIKSDYNWWSEIHKDPVRYRKEKERMKKEVLSVLEERFPAIKGRVEQSDVATPMTYLHYCNAWQGAWMSWIPRPKSTPMRYIPGNLEGLDNFYMAGQWTMPPGGLPGAAIPGKHVIYRICSNEGIPFASSSAGEQIPQHAQSMT